MKKRSHQQQHQSRIRKKNNLLIVSMQLFIHQIVIQLKIIITSSRLDSTRLLDKQCVFDFSCFINFQIF